MYKRKWKLFRISNKKDILVKVDTHSRLCVDLESEMGTSVVHIKHKLKNYEATERSYVQCHTVYQNASLGYYLYFVANTLFSQFLLFSV